MTKQEKIEFYHTIKQALARAFPSLSSTFTVDTLSQSDILDAVQSALDLGGLNIGNSAAVLGNIVGGALHYNELPTADQLGGALFPYDLALLLADDGDYSKGIYYWSGSEWKLLTTSDGEIPTQEELDQALAD